jgi:hypothetical protein
MALSPEQRHSLLTAKVRALVAGTWRSAASGPGSVESLQNFPFMAGAGLVDSSTNTAWLLVDESRIERDPMDAATSAATLPRGWLGGAIVAATRKGVAELHILADNLTGDDARRASYFKLQPQLWRVVGRSVLPVSSTPFVMPPDPSAVEMLFAEVIEKAGAEAVVDHGVLKAEVLGLEVGRVTLDEDDVPHLDVGVGRHDQLAQAMMYGTAQVDESLRVAVAAVRNFRNRTAGSHPANQLSPERWLRSLVPGMPILAGFAPDEQATFTFVAGTEPVRLKHPSPAIALVDFVDLETSEPRQAVLGVSVGVDLDAPAYAADARNFYRPNAELYLLWPEGTNIDAMTQAAQALATPVQWANVPNNWRTVLA